MSEFRIPGVDIQAFVRATLDEDLGVGMPGGGWDVTSNTVIDGDMFFFGKIYARETLCVAGLPIAASFFRALDPTVCISLLAADSQIVPPGTALMQIEGLARAMLIAERSALNTLQHLSGIASLTRKYVARTRGKATLLDTRKTLPGLRHLEKYAARMGGAANHRMGLWDAAMIKDNHIAAAGSVWQAVARAKAIGTKLVICEIDHLEQIEPAIRAGANYLLLDNMNAATLRQAVRIVDSRVPCEASGGITLATIEEIAATGVNYVSTGRITQSAPAVDIGLDFIPLQASHRR